MGPTIWYCDGHVIVLFAPLGSHVRVTVAVVPAPSLTVYDTCWYWAFYDIPLVHPAKRA